MLLLGPVVIVAAAEIPLVLVDDGAAAVLLGDLGVSTAAVVVASDDPNGTGVSVAPASAPAASRLVAVLAAFCLGEDFGAESAATGGESDVADCGADEAAFLAFVSGLITEASVSFFAAAAATVPADFRDLVGDFGGAAGVDVAGVLLAVLVVVEEGVPFSVVVSFGFLARLARFFGLGDSATGVSAGSAASLAAVHEQVTLKNERKSV